MQIFLPVSNLRPKTPVLGTWRSGFCFYLGLRQSHWEIFILCGNHLCNSVCKNVGASGPHAFHTESRSLWKAKSTHLSRMLSAKEPSTLLTTSLYLCFYAYWGKKNFPSIMLTETRQLILWGSPTEKREHPCACPAHEQLWIVSYRARKGQMQSLFTTDTTPSASELSQAQSQAVVRFSYSFHPTKSPRTSVF